jgi:kynurenine formamidase
MPRLIDLSLSLKPGMRGVSVTPAYTVAKDGWNAANWNLYSHAGTHVDSPFHFEAAPTTIDQMPLDAFCGLAWVARIPNCQPRQWLTPPDLGAVADRVEPGDCLLLHTGWSLHVDSREIYRDGLPRISDELAHWLVERKVKLIGVEPPSVADVNDLEEVTRIHKILLGAGITICEGLCNLDQLGERTFFMALPLKLYGGDGCPARAVAIEGDVGG